jgi:hypothetical protein
MAKMKALEDENRRLKKMYVDEKLKAEILQEAISTAGDGLQGSCREGSHDRAGVRRVCDQRELLPLPTEAAAGERSDRSLLLTPGMTDSDSTALSKNPASCTPPSETSNPWTSAPVSSYKCLISAPSPNPASQIRAPPSLHRDEQCGPNGYA